MMFGTVRERVAVLRRMGYPAWTHPPDAAKLNAVVTDVVRWNHERDKPRWYHYVLRAYYRVALPRKDWRLPWR